MEEMLRIYFQRETMRAVVGISPYDITKKHTERVKSFPYGLNFV